MKKTTKIFTALFVAAVISGGVYYTQFPPEQREIRQLEKNVKQWNDYGDMEAKKTLEKFPPERLRLLAERNNAAAQYQLGVYYLEKEQNELAEKWFKKSAAQYFAAAYRALALIERDRKNRQEYINLLKDAIKYGDKQSQMFLASNILIEDKDQLTAFMLVDELAQKNFLGTSSARAMVF